MEYPTAYERELTLDDGRVVTVRPIVPEDAELLQAEFDAADPETLYRRFMTPSPKLPQSRFRFLATVDYTYRFAVVVFSPDGEGVAIARYEGHPTKFDAEVAVVVKPDWRQVGLARRLFAMLDERATESGITHLNAVYLAENDAAAALMATSGFGAPHIEGGVVEVGKDIAVPAG
ncbi:MAG: GNAT family N-acetyltransferase [Acidimicrobiia bacterium]|nr:GNAT family N-acetyltransferase [Acidimicrobiia bacterium]